MFFQEFYISYRQYRYRSLPLSLKHIDRYALISCGENRHRISHDLLSRPKNLGGIGLPNIFHYHTATRLTRIVDWNVHTQKKDWVSLEASFTKLSLNSLPWNSPKQVPPDIQTHPMIGPTLRCFHQSCKKTSISSNPGPLTPIKLNPDFPPGMHHQFLSDNLPQGQIRAHQFHTQGKLLTAAQIATHFEKTPIPPWSYLMIAHYLKTLDKKGQCSRSLHHTNYYVLKQRHKPILSPAYTTSSSLT